MALIKCPDCATEISDQAPACPKCGRPTINAKPDAKKHASPLILPGMILAGVGGFMFFTDYARFIGVLAMLAGAVLFLIGLVTRPK